MRLSFSRTELNDLAKAWIIISIAFAIVLSDGILTFSLLTNIIIAAVTVGTGFLLHELGHKVVAQRYGCWAEFRADNFMLLLAFVTSFLGIIFAAPGAVMIAGRVSTRRNGIISVAGPLVNIILALVFLLIGIFFPTGFVGNIATFGYIVNTWLAMFNLLPLWILDGKKVFDWNKLVWGSALAFAILLFFFQGILPYVAAP